MTNSRNKLPISFPTDFSFRQRQSHNWWRRNQPFNWRLAKNRTCCKASVFCIRYFRNYLYLHSGKRKFSGTFFSRGWRNRLIKNIYLQKCTAPDKPRTVHFFNFTISQFFKQEFHKRICFLNANIPSLPSPTKSSGVSGIGCFSLKNSVIWKPQTFT